MTRRTLALLLAGTFLVSFGHSALTIDAPELVRYEDGSYSDGTCEVGAPCDDTTDR